MKSFFCFITFTLSMAGTAQASQLSLVLGEPNQNLSFVKATLRDHTALTNGLLEQDLTTFLFSLFYYRGLSQVSNVGVVSSDGSAASADVFKSYTLAASQSPVVLNVLGGQSEDLCRLMASHSKTSFVFANKSLNLTREPSCLAKNILFPAALRADGNDVLPFSGTGLGYRIGAIGEKVPGFDLAGKATQRTSMSAASAIVASHLARYAEETGLRGADLIESFLTHKTIIKTSLFGKIESGRVLVEE